jgi:ABC-type multidrug transport system ATPase subunit
VLGPNGSGKTTVVRILVTLLRATSGVARVGGHDVGRNPGLVRQLIGYAGQYAGVDDDLTVAENLLLSGGLHGLGQTDSRRHGNTLIDVLGLGGAADKQAGRLSGGMRRRLDLALAMVHRPNVLFLDEPTTGLDPQARNALWDYLRSLRTDGTTILLTTQYLEEADLLCDRVAILDQGHIVTLGVPATLKAAVGEDRVTLTLGHPDDEAQTALVRRVAEATPGIVKVLAQYGTITVQLGAAATTLPELIRRLDGENVAIARFQLTPHDAR